MKRKVLSVLLCAAMTLGVVAGCGSSSDTGSTDSASKTETKGEKTDSSSDKVTIRMSYWNSEDTVQAMLDYLAEAVPEVEIEYQFIDNSNYDTIIDTQLSAGEGPDIICESPGSALKHAKLGYLEALDDLAAIIPQQVQVFTDITEVPMHFRESAGLKESIITKKFLKKIMWNFQRHLMSF